MDIGIAVDLKSDHRLEAGDPEDRLEEYDSPVTVEAIEEALRRAGHVPRRLGGGRAFLERVLAAPPELVFNIAEGRGTRSREAHVPAVCEMLGIPFTHSDPLTAAITLDKAVAKRVAASAGVHTPRFAVLERVAQAHTTELAFPLIAKPLWEGSSMGVRNDSRAVDPDSLAALVERLLEAYGEPVLVEEFCSGPEFTVGILGNGAAARVLGVMEIRPRRRPLEEFVYSLDVKRDWEQEIELLVSPDRPAKMLAEVEATALGAFRALGCRDVSRVDVRVDARGRPAFLEINPMPGLRPEHGDLCLIANGMGHSYQELIEAILDSACLRLGLGPTASVRAAGS